VAPSKISGPGYELSFVGSQRQTIMTGDRAAHLDLRTLKGRPHLYGIGPIEGLAGEVTIADSRPSLACAVAMPEAQMRAMVAIDARCCAAPGVIADV